MSDAVRKIEIRNHTRNVYEIQTSAEVNAVGALVPKGQGKQFVLFLGGSDDGAAVRRRGKDADGPNLDNRVKIDAPVWDKIKTDRVIAAMLESGDLEAVGA